MIRAGIKMEEYREIKPHWISRLLTFRGKLSNHAMAEFIWNLKNPAARSFVYPGVREVFKDFGAFARKFDVVRIKNGYREDSPVMDVEFKSFRIGQGHQVWGAEAGKACFVLELGSGQHNNAPLETTPRGPESGIFHKKSIWKSVIISTMNMICKSRKPLEMSLFSGTLTLRLHYRNQGRSVTQMMYLVDFLPYSPKTREINKYTGYWKLGNTGLPTTYSLSQESICRNSCGWGLIYLGKPL